MHEKVWVIVFRRVKGRLQLLALKPNPEPNRNTDYYVVTGGIEIGETPMQAAARETFEEVGIEPLKVYDLGESITYIDKISGHEYIEHCYAAEIDNSKITLSIEHIDYKWLKSDEFVRAIWWEGDRLMLTQLIEQIERAIE